MKGLVLGSVALIAISVSIPAHAADMTVKAPSDKGAAARLKQLTSDKLGTAGIWPSAAHNLAMTFYLHGPACSG